MHTKRHMPVIIILGLLLILTACNSNDGQVLPTVVGEDNQDVSDDNADTSTTDEVGNADSETANVSFDDMESGTHELDISGAFTSDGSYSGEEVIASYEPFNSSNSTGQT